MSFLGTIFGGARKHDEKMEKIRRDEKRQDDITAEHIAAYNHGMMPLETGGAKLLGGIGAGMAAGIPAFASAAGAALGGGAGARGFGGDASTPQSSPNHQGGGPSAGGNNMLLWLGLAALVFFGLKKS